MVGKDPQEVKALIEAEGQGYEVTNQSVFDKVDKGWKQKNNIVLTSLSLDCLKNA